MKCTFYRPENTDIHEFSEIIAKLLSDLTELEGSTNREEITSYALELLSLAKPLAANSFMRFFGLDEHDHMPGDARIDFFYRPTYIATVLVMNAALKYPEIITDSMENEASLRACMLGCTGHNFTGHGYDELSGLIETMEFFAGHKVGEFLARFDICPEFSDLYERSIAFLLEKVMDGSVTGDWGVDFTDRTYALLVNAGKLPHGLTVKNQYNGKRLYLAYGSNLDRKQMAWRCPGAVVVGTAELNDWRLMFKGSKSGKYLTIEQQQGYSVPVAVWELAGNNERSLDRYEDFPAFYYKKELPVAMKSFGSDETLLVRGFVYIMHEDRKLGCPSGDYFGCCLHAYQNFGFDDKTLLDAYEYSRNS